MEKKPQATELAYELRQAGMPLREGILTREELTEELVPLLRRGRVKEDA